MVAPTGEAGTSRSSEVHTTDAGQRNTEDPRAKDIPVWSLLLSAALAQDLLITDARLIDGTGAPPIPQASVLVLDGRIAGVWPGEAPPPPPGVEVLDVDGSTLMPGWFDAHVHLYADAGATLREEPLVWDAAAMDRRLRAYLACGVTSVLDAGSPHLLVEAIRDFQQDHVGPEISFLGEPLSPPGGYMDQLAIGLPSQGTPEEIVSHLDRLVDMGASGVKLTVEDGFITRNWPIYDPTQLRALHREAEARELGVFVHAMTPLEQLVALEARPRALVHTAFSGNPTHLARVAASGTWQISTLSVVDGMRLTHHPERLATPLVHTVIPERIRASAVDPVLRKDSATAILEIMAPELPSPAVAVLRRGVTADTTYHFKLRRMERTLIRLHRAGVPIVLGSDSGNWSVLTGFPHGVTTLREAELLEEAGLTPMEVIQAGTSQAAELLGVSQDRGTIAPGKRADLVILEEDPLLGIDAVWTVQWTLKDGVAKTPQEWMNPGPKPDGP